MNLVKLKDSGLTIKRNTIYNYFREGKYPKLFKKIMGRYYIDMDEWNLMAKSPKGYIRIKKTIQDRRDQLRSIIDIIIDINSKIGEIKTVRELNYVIQCLQQFKEKI